MTAEEGAIHHLVTPDSCLPAMHRGCVLVVAVVMLCDSGKRDRQGSGGEGREHVGESRRMKDWGSGRERPCGCCGECVVVVVSVVAIFCMGHSAVTHGLVDTERTHAIYLIM